MTDKADRGLVRAEEAGAALPKEGSRKATPAPCPPHSTQCVGWADPVGTMSVGTWPEGPRTTVCCQPGWPGEVWRQGLGGLHPDPPTQPHSLRAFEESSSTVPALMPAAMGTTPFSCSWRLCRGRAGEGSTRPRWLRSPGKTWCLARCSRRRLLFLTDGGDTLRMPVGQRVGSMKGRWKEHACWPQAGEAGGLLDGEQRCAHPTHLCEVGQKGLEAGPGPSQVRASPFSRGRSSEACYSLPLLWSQSLLGQDLPGPPGPHLVDRGSVDKAQRRQSGESPPYSTSQKSQPLCPPTAPRRPQQPCTGPPLGVLCRQSLGPRPQQAVPAWFSREGCLLSSSLPPPRCLMSG